MEESTSSVRVNIYGDEYQIKGDADPEYIYRLASFVDDKMKGIAQKVPPRDKMKVAILAAFNIASELFEVRGEPGSDTQKTLWEIRLKAEELTEKVEKGIKNEE